MDDIISIFRLSRYLWNEVTKKDLPVHIIKEKVPNLVRRIAYGSIRVNKNSTVYPLIQLTYISLHNLNVDIEVKLGNKHTPLQKESATYMLIS